SMINASNFATRLSSLENIHSEDWKKASTSLQSQRMLEFLKLKSFKVEKKEEGEHSIPKEEKLEGETDVGGMDMPPLIKHDPKEVSIKEEPKEEGDSSHRKRKMTIPSEAGRKRNKRGESQKHISSFFVKKEKEGVT